METTTTTVLTRTEIKNLEVDLPNILVVGLVIGKQEPRQLQSQATQTERRSVWNFTIRDSPRDYINVTYWGKSDTVTELDTIIAIGSIIEITTPKISLRKSNEIGEQYRPNVTSPFHITVSEGSSSVRKSRENIEALSKLIHYPTKPMFNYTTIDYISKNIHTINGLLFDLLVAVRHVGDLRVIRTKNGFKEMRRLVVLDASNPAMVINLWNHDYTSRSSLWKPRETILYITDCKVQYDRFSNSPTGTPSMKSIITENPEGNEAVLLKEYAKTVQLNSSAFMDMVVGAMPEAYSIKTTMNVRQISAKMLQIVNSNSARVEDNQFAVILYGYVTQFDIDGISRIFSYRCSLCKSMVNSEQECYNQFCLSNTSGNEKEILKTFDMRLQITDRTGTLTQCRLSGQNAETVLNCNPETFTNMTDKERSNIKWKFLLEFCELRLVITLKNKKPMTTVLTCQHSDVTVNGV